MSAFFAMDGYAAYIWPAYGLTALGVVVLLVQVFRARAKARARLAELESENDA